MNKKGAIEFSMTLIMIIIIGIAVLALGLAWVRGTFTQIGTLTEQSLDAAETVIGEVAFTGKMSAPATINMDLNDAKKFRILVRNQQDVEDTFTFTATDVDDCLTVVGVASKVKVPKGDIGELTGGLVSECDDDINIIVPIKIIGDVFSATDAYATDAIAVQIS